MAMAMTMTIGGGATFIILRGANETNNNRYLKLDQLFGLQSSIKTQSIGD